MSATLNDFISTRPEYSRMERYLDLAQLYISLGQPERAWDPLEKYMKWYPADAQALAAKQELLLLRQTKENAG
jgi:hypothetical protein